MTRDLSAEARSAKVDQLDQAIDHVAARLTHVTDDEGLALRIIETLPERSGWSLHWLMPRVAFTALLAVATAYVVLRPFDDRSPTVLRTENASEPTVAASPIVERPANDSRTNVEPTLFVRRTAAERSPNESRTIEDHERSLDALEGPAALSLMTLGPSDLPSQGALIVEPLAIADLPLTAEPISPR